MSDSSSRWPCELRSEAVLAAADLRRLLERRVDDMADDGITACKMEVWISATDPRVYVAKGEGRLVHHFDREQSNVVNAE
jgi:hypothetical protein